MKEPRLAESSRPSREAPPPPPRESGGGGTACATTPSSPGSSDYNLSLYKNKCFSNIFFNNRNPTKCDFCLSLSRKLGVCVFPLFIQNTSLCAQHSSRLVYELFHEILFLVLFSNEKKIHSQSHPPIISLSRAHRAAPGLPGETRVAYFYHRQLLKLLRSIQWEKQYINVFGFFYVCYVCVICYRYVSYSPRRFCNLLIFFYSFLCLLYFLTRLCLSLTFWARNIFSIPRKESAATVSRVAPGAVLSITVKGIGRYSEPFALGAVQIHNTQRGDRLTRMRTGLSARQKKKTKNKME